jgi:hypothetical protein
MTECEKSYFKGLQRKTVYSAHGWFLNLESKDQLHNHPSSSTTSTTTKTAISSFDRAIETRSATHFHNSFYRPVCIGTLRDPLKRLISHYEYLHEGPRSIASIERHSSKSSPSSSSSSSSAANMLLSPSSDGGGKKHVPDFATCISEYMDKKQLGLSETEADAWNCMHWANIQLKYFCG